MLDKATEIMNMAQALRSIGTIKQNDDSDSHCRAVALANCTLMTHDAMDARIANALGKHINVVFSAYEICGDGEPGDDGLYCHGNSLVDADFESAVIQGPCIFSTERDEFWGGCETEDYQSEVLTDPTWLDILKAADDMICVTKDTHHCFLEAVHRDSQSQEINGVPVYRFSMGS